MKVITGTGQEIDLGTVEASPTISIVDYSRRVTDDFGTTTVVKRGFSRRLSVRLALPFDQVDSLQQQLAELRATPAQWVADDQFDWLNVEGFYKDFELDLAVPPLSYCTLTVEGLAETEAGEDAGGDPAPIGSTSSLRLLQPVAVTGAMLVASSVAEDDHAEWDTVTTYAAGARVIKAALHRIFESLEPGNLGNDPAGDSGKWIDVGPTKRWAMFDQALGTATTAASNISVTLSVSDVNAVALLDVVASSVRVQAPGYDQTRPVDAGGALFLNVPETTGQIIVTVSGTGQRSVGTLLAGRIVDLGLTEASPTAGIIDYSRKETDDFGEVTVVERAWAKRMAAQALIRTDAVDQVANRIAAVRGVPSLWIGDEGLSSLLIYGFFKDFSIKLSENVSLLSVSIEGLSKAAPLLPMVAPLIIQWSVDGEGDWHGTFAPGDLYMRLSTNGGSSFGEPVRAVGATGGQGNFTRHVFKRSATVPETPTGDGVPLTWSAQPPEGADPLYMSVALQDADEVLVAGEVWSPPVRLDGAEGATAKTITVSSDRSAFTFDGANNLSPASQSSVVTANPQNFVGGAVVWSYADNLGTASATLAAMVTNTSTNVRTIPSSVFTGTPARQWLKVTATGQGDEASLSDGDTIYRLADGSGVLTITLTNDSHNVPTDSAGASGNFTGANGLLRVFYGGTDVTAAATLSEVSETGCTGEINTATNTPIAGQAKGYYRVTALSADTAIYRMRAVYDPGSGNITQDKDFSLSKAKQGGTGNTGNAGSSSAVVSLYLRSASAPASVPTGTFTYTFATGVLSGGTLNGWSQAIPAGTNPLYVVEALATSNTATAAVTTWTSPVKIVENGAPGPVLTLKAPTDSFIQIDGALNPASQTITLTSFVDSVATNVAWTIKQPNGATIRTVASANSLAVTQADLGSHASLLIEAVYGTATAVATLNRKDSLSTGFLDTISYTRSNALDAGGALLNVAADGVLTKQDKKTRIEPEIAVIQASYARYQAEALARGVTTEKTAHTTAYNNLGAAAGATTGYLAPFHATTNPNGTSIRNTGVATAIDLTTFKNYFSAYYDAEAALIAACNAKAASTADLNGGIMDSAAGSSIVARSEIRTPLGTAAAIAGQGTLATKNAVDLATSEVLGKSLLNVDAPAATKLGTIDTAATAGDNILPNASWAVDTANWNIGTGVRTVAAGQAVYISYAAGGTLSCGPVPVTGARRLYISFDKRGQLANQQVAFDFTILDSTLAQIGGASVGVGANSSLGTDGSVTGAWRINNFQGAAGAWTTVDLGYVDLPAGAHAIAITPIYTGGGYHHAGKIRISPTQRSATVGAAAGTNLYRADGLTVLSQAEVRTPEGTAAAIAGQGAFATVSSAAYGSPLLTGFGAVSPLNEVVFGGSYFKETAGGTIASLANFKTSSGTAAAIAGQGAFATLNNAAYGSSLLSGFGALAPRSELYFGDGYLKETLGGTTATLTAFKTSSGTAAAIAGQGTLATRNNARLGYELLREDGATLLTNADAITSFGTAAGIAGQGGLATKSIVKLNAEVYRANGTTLLTNADAITSLGVAASIAGQGTGATANNLTGLNAQEGAKLTGSDYGATLGDNLIFNSRLLIDTSSFRLTNMTRGVAIAGDAIPFFLEKASGVATGVYDNGGGTGPGGTHPVPGVGTQFYLSYWARGKPGQQLTCSIYWYSYIAGTLAFVSQSAVLNAFPTDLTMKEYATVVTKPDAASYFYIDGAAAESGVAGLMKIGGWRLAPTERGANVTENRPIVSRLDAVTGVASNSSILPANVTYGLIPALKDDVVISDTSNGGTVTINIGSAVNYPDVGGTVTFPSGSVAGLAYGTKYFIKRVGVNAVNSPTGTGWSASTTLTIGVGDVYIKPYTTRATSGSPSPPPPPPPGNGQDCVWAEAWVETRDSGFKRAKDIAPGDHIRVLNGDMDGTRWERVTANSQAQSEMVEIVSDSGVTLKVSVNTPLVLRDGTLCWVTEVDDPELPLHVDGEFRWEQCRVSRIGEGPVSHIRCSMNVYAAGNEKGRAILTHNPIYKP
jgi:hypothetical protein